MKIGRLLFAMLFWYLPLQAQEPDTIKQFIATRITTSPKIDGKTDDPVWQSLPVLRGFTQYKPEFGAKESQKTEVRIAYDDKSLYILRSEEHTSDPVTLESRMPSSA